MGAGAIGLIASFVLTIDKIKLLINPAYVPSCNLNPLISCGSVMQTTQAHAFGFMNSLIGLVGFGVVICIGAMMLAGADKLKRWFWLGLQAGATFGFVFIHWLAFQSIYRIHALCPYCMVVWAVTATIFWYVTLWNLRTGVIKTPKRCRGTVAFMQRHHGDLLLLWFLVITGLILNHFWYYWKTLI